MKFPIDIELKFRYTLAIKKYKYNYKIQLIGGFGNPISHE